MVLESTKNFSVKSWVEASHVMHLNAEGRHVRGFQCSRALSQ